MLSVTNTVDDIKKKLRNGFAFYKFADDAAFVAAIEESVDTVKYSEMIPYMGKESGIYNAESCYNSIADKDKIGLNLIEQYIYKAETWFSCSEFVESNANDELYQLSGNSISISIPGFSRDIEGAGITKKTVSSYYYSKGFEMINLAGFKVSSLYRGGR